MKKRIIALLCIMALLIAGGNHVTTVTTVQAAGKIKVIKKLPKMKEKYAAGAPSTFCKYKSKTYIWTWPGGKRTFYNYVPKSGGKDTEKKLFKGSPLWVATSEQSLSMNLGEKKSYAIKIRKGVKVLAIGSVAQGNYGSLDGPYAKLISANKNSITLEAVKEGDKVHIPLQLYFTYKGKRYFYDYALTNKSAKRIGWNVLDA